MVDVLRDRESSSSLSTLRYSIGKKTGKRVLLDEQTVETGTQAEAEDIMPDDGNLEFRWVDIIFLPFHEWWKCMILFTVIVKCFFGPLMSVYPFFICDDEIEGENIIKYTYDFLKIWYLYVGNSLYLVDTFLHMAHRQITDEAMKREFVPKRGLHIIIDILSLLPFDSLVMDERCGVVLLWPNVLRFGDFFVIYRIVEYFNLYITHRYSDIFIGYGIMFVLVTNAMACLLLLFTINGLCAKCTEGIYDWRKFNYYMVVNPEGFVKKYNIEHFAWYLYAAEYLKSFLSHYCIDDTRPTTHFELCIACVLMELGFFLIVYVFIPKLFAENLYRLSWVTGFQPRVKRIIEEIKRRNPSPTAHASVEKFYSMMWYKQQGITAIPHAIWSLPRGLRLDIRYDLIWYIFHHSPTFRQTSMAFKRYLCERVSVHYKLPGERLFVGPHCYTHLYYIKSGIVQLLSDDDSMAPMLSVTSGTIFGDISFLIPPLRRHKYVRCLTYCEIIYISRLDILISLHNFPKDRRNVMKLAQQRLQHAHDLFEYKTSMRGRDRCEDEGIAWIKQAWWEILDAMRLWKYNRSASKKPFQVNFDDDLHHCPKYIGQLVLCQDEQLRKKSVFLKFSFPWILASKSNFRKMWYRLIIFTVHVALLVFPPNIVRAKVNKIRMWYTIFNFSVNTIYFIDVIIAIITATEGKHRTESNLALTMLARLANKKFFLDVLSLPFIDKIVILLQYNEYYHLAQFNRLIKTYILFTDEYKSNWKIDQMRHTLYRLTLIYFIFLYVPAYFLYLIQLSTPFITLHYFYGDLCLPPEFISAKNGCDHGGDNYGVFSIVLTWISTLNFFYPSNRNVIDVAVAFCTSTLYFLILALILKSKLIATLYVKHRRMVEFQYLVTNIKKHYTYRKIHIDLMKRLNLYLNVNWKYHKGMDITNPNLLKNEPFDVYWKLHGEVAERMIGESRAFRDADPALIKDLAHSAKFQIWPKGACIYTVGVRIETVTWLVRGAVKTEYQDASGETRTNILDAGRCLVVMSFFIHYTPVTTFIAASDCEILYINVSEFTSILKRYPDEWRIVEACVEELKPSFRQYYKMNTSEHLEYQKRLRSRIFHYKKSLTNLRSEESRLQFTIARLNIKIPVFIKRFRRDPESKTALCWMCVRALAVIGSIVCSSLQAGSGAPIYKQLNVAIGICDFIAFIDIIVKLFLPFYDKRGLIITDYKKCAVHYLTRGFFMDIVGLVMSQTLGISFLVNLQRIVLHQSLMVLFRFCHLYLLIGLFHYYANRPSISDMHIMILKWQVLTVLILLGASFYFMLNCVQIEFDEDDNLVNLLYLNSTCWLPSYFGFSTKTKLTTHDLHLIYGQCLSLVQSGFLKTLSEKFEFPQMRIFHSFIYIALGLFHWNQLCRCTAFLMLRHRGDSMLHHGINQLKEFLQTERVERRVIDRAVEYFNYWYKRAAWRRSESNMVDQFGVVFRQDLFYYFSTATLIGTDVLLKGGETVMRHLAAAAHTIYFLPAEDIIREMYLSPHLYIVNRGKVQILQNDDKIAILSKGDIFGQLQGTVIRPSRVTARPIVPTDLMQISVKEFQQIINDDTRAVISQTKSNEYDYMSLGYVIKEDPLNTIEYILRRKKNIKFPLRQMTQPISAETNAWYGRWLLLSWVVSPTVSAIIVLLMYNFADHVSRVMWIVYFWDIQHAVYLVTECFTMELTATTDTCLYKYIGWRKLLEWWLYIDLVSVILSLYAIISSTVEYQLGRLLRLYTVYLYHQTFCRSFRARTESVILKIVMVLLFIHVLTCTWIGIACRSKRDLDGFPVKFVELPKSFTKFVDYTTWANPLDRKQGCARAAVGVSSNGTNVESFLVAKSWGADYLVSLTYIIILQTYTNYDLIRPLTVEDVFFKVFAEYLLYLVQLWMSTVVISAVYTKMREMYHYDMSVASLIMYMEHNSISKTLQNIVKTYTRLLWQRYRGSQLPAITYQAPQCLQEDILSALYLYHLETPTLFRNLPKYFLRQLAVKLGRKVILPGRSIVLEGDIFPCMLFIHDGEVEKWCTNHDGENQMTGMLGTNGYFGLIPGLFPEIPYQFSYYSRTVVDLLILRHEDWLELLNAYPDVKESLYKAANKLKTRRKTSEKQI